uniref:Uncharacterized protein n=1 Tax=Arundo donax TaxID=35708 RepID=A0A0A8ZKV1_ARUDO
MCVYACLNLCCLLLGCCLRCIFSVVKLYIL